MSVDPKTGKITTVQNMDRESPFIKNGTYTVVIHAIDDGKHKTICSQYDQHNPNFCEYIETNFTFIKNTNLISECSCRLLFPTYCSQGSLQLQAHVL